MKSPCSRVNTSHAAPTAGPRFSSNWCRPHRTWAQPADFALCSTNCRQMRNLKKKRTPRPRVSHADLSQETKSLTPARRLAPDFRARGLGALDADQAKRQRAPEHFAAYLHRNALSIVGVPD